MSHERVGAFNDAIIAIVMTIIVLEFQVPSPLTADALIALWPELVSYAISFFWLGCMWVNQHNFWQITDRITTPAILLDLVMLFFSSLFPFTTQMVASDPWNPVGQVAYGVVILAVTFANVALFSRLRTDNAHVEGIPTAILSSAPRMWADIALKLVGLVLSATIFPPAVSCAVLVTLLALVIPAQLKE